jgi:hypothetical protein
VRLINEYLLAAKKKKIDEDETITDMDSSDTHEVQDTSEAFFAKLYRDYPQDLVAFSHFLHMGGKFLTETPAKALPAPELVADAFSGGFMLSQLLATYNTSAAACQSIRSTTDLQATITTTTHDLHHERYYPRIRSGIDGQDRGAMVYLRELVQNARDAILAARKKRPMVVTSRGEDDPFSSG